MASYDYKCNNNSCTEFDKVVEYNLPMNHDKPNCLTCESVMAQKFFAAPVHFNGDGFYSTGG